MFRKFSGFWPRQGLGFGVGAYQMTVDIHLSGDLVHRSATPDAMPDHIADANIASHADPTLIEIGTIAAITGARATVDLDREQLTSAAHAQDNPHVGTMMSIDTGRTVALGLVTSISSLNDAGSASGQKWQMVLELVGELLREKDGYLKTCRRGISVYPRLGDGVCVASADLLRKTYQYGDFDGAEIGHINQDSNIPAVVKVDEMLGKHFAIVGSTGTGKSCVVALMLRQVLAGHPNAHIVLLDPHNEYANCFDDKVELVTLQDMSLPFWFLTFEEIVETLLGDAVKYADEVEILRDLIPIAKRQFGSNGTGASVLLNRVASARKARYSVDIPSPYLISDLIGLIDEQLGKLEKQNGLAPLKHLKARIESITLDPRYEFMFGSLTVHDNLAKVIKRLFRIPVAGRPISVIQLMGLPSEIVNVVVSVLARLAFDVAMSSDGKIPITFVCEEAHRYVPHDTSTGFEPTKRAISRIAKEGRKYGASLCIVSQRPGDLDTTILSQCSTVFAMRLSNERDQNIIKSALSEATTGMLDFLSSLGTRECIAFGEGVSLPSRISFLELPNYALPKGGGATVTKAWSEDVADDGMLEDIVGRWRLSAHQEHAGDTIQEVFGHLAEEGTGAQSANAVTPDHDPGPFSQNMPQANPVNPMAQQSMAPNTISAHPPASANGSAPAQLTPAMPAMPAIRQKRTILKPGTDFAKRFGG